MRRMWKEDIRGKLRQAWGRGVCVCVGWEETEGKKGGECKVGKAEGIWRRDMEKGVPHRTRL